MNPTSNCQTIPLDSLLRDELTARDSELCEQHLADCESCQRKLAVIAAEDHWWTAAARHLSTVEQLRLAPADAKLLSASSEFFASSIIPQLPATASTKSPNDWVAILDPPTHPEMLGRIDQFEIEDKIGSGGMGIVLKGFDRQLNRAVAIKILAPHLASHGTARKRFAREAQAAAAVVHPNVIPIYAVNSSETRPYIVMQLVSGHSLHSLVAERGPLEVMEIVRIGIQIAAGLSAAHQQGLIHRDIKPANILIEHDVARVVITDFGLARAADDAGMTQTGWIAGTPHYMSPEQASGENLDLRSDLFSLGGLLYFLATGREPFRGDKPYAVIQKILNQQPVPLQSLNPDVPLMLSDIVEKLQEKNPADRFDSAATVQRYLERYLAHLQQPLQVPKPNRVLTARRRRARTIRTICVFTFATMLLAATVWFASGHSGDNSATRIVNGTGGNEMELAVPVSAPFESFFADQKYFSEINSVQQSLGDLENSMQSTSPFAETNFFAPDTPDEPMSIRLQRLETETDRYQQSQSFEAERIKALLNQSKAANEKEPTVREAEKQEHGENDAELDVEKSGEHQSTLMNTNRRDK